ncbi:MAG TPA: hypothetical protein VES65_02225 [Solirubrobacteraceae bacterium]|nr:hypothetical protein [Solirubrobacteraceae bacterium]
MKHSRLIVAAAFAAAALPAVAVPLASQASTGRAARSSGTPVTVRVEGIASTLLAETAIDAKAASIDRDGKPADACTGDTAAVALQDATHGNWTAGPYSSGLGYPVIGIRGESHPFTSAYYWSLWIDGKPASTGVCGATLHRGERLLFFPQCSQESASSCPRGMFDPAVLQLTGPASARVGKAITLKVSSLEDLTGKTSPGAGVKLSAAGHTITTGASGRAKLTFAKTGRYRIVASARDSVRDELIVTVGARSG